MFEFHRISFLAVLLCAMSGNASADQSTPKGAALAFGNALLAGDSATQKATAVGSETDYKVLESINAMVGAMKSLHDAAAEKFGKGNPISSVFKEDVAGELEKSVVKEEGDTATIVDPEKERKNPMKLVKKDGKWFVDLAATFPKDAAERTMKLAPAMVKIATEVTADIKAGKFKDATEAQQALQTKMIEAMKQMPGPRQPSEEMPRQ